MDTVKLTPQQLKTVVRESVKEAFEAEIMKLRAAVLPFVSQQEQKDIERRHKKSSRKAVKTHTIDA
jgi:hypothetical protein